ncbi:hypothetical protein M0805_000736 [Coniferiporia weirii]|nr:hypothetical protein M0805_000736 [Coniferiporia weirii]
MPAVSLPLSIRTNGDDIEIVNQLLLPHAVEFVPINSIEDAHDAIKTMKIRGAPAIGSLAALAFASSLSRALATSPAPSFLSSLDALSAHVQPQLDFLFTARPTAVNLGGATRRLAGVLGRGVQAGTDVRALAAELVAEGRAVADEDIGRNKEMSKHGADWLVQRTVEAGDDASALNVLTVCNTGSLATSGYGTALGLITRLLETGKLGKAYFTQTAPYHQGSRLTAFELQALNAPSVMICDTMVGSLFQHHKIHAVVVGADRVAKNGDTANKIGTYNAAVLAARHKIPFIVVAPVSTVDLDIPDGSHIPIEQRPWIEACLVRGAVYDTEGMAPTNKQAVVMLTPPGLQEANVYNPSFDVTPAELISAVVTEKGVACCPRYLSLLRNMSTPALGRRLCTSAVHATNRSLHILVLRLKRANLPLLIAFASALFMFLRALSGAGYTDPYTMNSPDGTLSSSYNDSLAHPELAAGWALDAPAGFAAHWARFKETLFTCPDDNTGAEGGTGMGAGVEGTQQKTGVACLQERIRNAVSARGSMLKGKTAAEGRAFGVSLNALPPRKDRAEESTATGTPRSSTADGASVSELETAGAPRWRRLR